MPEHELRANPLYTLCPFDRLPAAQRRDLAELAEDATFYGLLLPADGSGLPPKAVDEETALIWYTLQQPGAVPHYVRRKFGAGCERAIAALVLGGVLEVRTPGGFVTGPQARAAVLEPPAAADADDAGFLPRLSESALRYAQDLALDDEAATALRLYQFNGVPYTPDWAARLPDARSVLAWLQGAGGDDERRRLAERWKLAEPEGEDAAWWFWTRRDAAGAALAGRGAPYKLYVSAMPAALPALWWPLLRLLSRSEALAFKVGADVRGILRADKLVIYLGSFDALARLAERLREALPEAPVQGVPFTAPIDPAGLLSWGMDPPGGERPSLDPQGESWRQWICSELARALVEGQRAGAARLGCEPWQYALDRLGLEGVDTRRWTPRQSIWRAS